jgi:hypothetical protein
MSCSIGNLNSGSLLLLHLCMISLPKHIDYIMLYRFDGSLAFMQLSNGHLKLPSYFGVIAVLVCFMSAGFSLAFAFIIIPRQVMPWTGLLLMLEWTFVAFFLLFGSYLRFVYRWGSISANHVGFSNSDASENHMGPGMLNLVASQRVSSS